MDKKVEKIEKRLAEFKEMRAELDDLLSRAKNDGGSLDDERIGKIYKLLDSFIERREQGFFTEEQEPAPEELPNIKGALPDKYIHGNTKLQKKAFAEYDASETLLNQFVTLNVGGTEKKPVCLQDVILKVPTAPISIDETDKARLMAVDELTNYPNFCGNVFDAIMSLIKDRCSWEAGPGEDYAFNSDGPIFTAQEIYKMLTKDKKKRASAEMLKAIDEAIQAMEITTLESDLTEQWNQANELQYSFDSFRCSEKMLSIRRIDAMKNGKKVTAYQILIIPPLMRYSFAIGQIDTISIKDIPALSRASRQLINIHNYLLNEIRWEKYQWEKQQQEPRKQGRPKRKKQYIERKYDTIFRNADINPAGLDKKHAYEYKAQVCKMLEDFKSVDLIKDFEEIGENGRKNGRYKVRLWFTKKPKEGKKTEVKKKPLKEK